jgi:hypothetical protein
VSIVVDGGNEYEYIYLLDPSGNILTEATGDYLSPARLPASGLFTLPVSGTYIIEVTSVYSGLENGSWGDSEWPYTLTLATRILATKTFTSVSTQDGWILESSETSGQGGAMNATQTTFMLGDDALNRQYRGVLSFNTAGLPDNAAIQSAQIKIRQSGVPVGTNPFSVLGNLSVDVRKPYFGSAPGLQSTDFNAVPSRAQVGVFNKTPVSGWYHAVLNANGLSNINKTSLTQFRLYFSKDDNNNRLANFMRFFTGNALAANRPQLIVQYYYVP